MATNRPHHALANDIKALRERVAPARLKRHDAMKILTDEHQDLLVDAINTFQGVYSYAAAKAVVDTEPRYQLLCKRCGWTLAMICPECPQGCGCESGCSGWRHGGFVEEELDDVQYDHLADEPELHFAGQESDDDFEDAPELGPAEQEPDFDDFVGGPDDVGNAEEPPEDYYDEAEPSEEMPSLAYEEGWGADVAPEEGSYSEEPPF
ncbi:hypothetical protein ABZS76_32660 [Streptomyces sp. NPDC005562]|uniref:hypothetical protein n=1 Tax=Streptomyces sp. NPDC005562 TaxID=3154890 RepID=UPI0033B2EA4E